MLGLLDLRKHIRAPLYLDIQTPTRTLATPSPALGAPLGPLLDPLGPLRAPLWNVCTLCSPLVIINYPIFALRLLGSLEGPMLVSLRAFCCSQVFAFSKKTSPKKVYLAQANYICVSSVRGPDFCLGGDRGGGGPTPIFPGAHSGCLRACLGAPLWN